MPHILSGCGLLTQRLFSLLNNRLVIRNVLIILALSAALPAVAVDSKPPNAGMEIQTAWIPMPDGIRLSADLYRPTGGDSAGKSPVLLEYLPYRKHEARSRNWPLY